MFAILKFDNKDKYQLAIESNQFMNYKDDPVKIDFVKIHFNDKSLNKWFDDVINNCKIITIGKIPLQHELFSSINDLHCLINLEILVIEAHFDQPLNNSLDKLTNLKHLEFHGFIQPLGSSLDKLTNLESLDLGFSFKEPLGNSLDKLTNLKYLSLARYYRQPLGNSLDKLINLEVLKIQNYKQPLGNSLDKLINLKSLNLLNYEYSFGNSLDKLINLKELNGKPYIKN